MNRSVTRLGVLAALTLAVASALSAPSPATASAVCPPPGTLSQIIAVDATYRGPLTEQFPPVFGVYSESAAACWPGVEIELAGYITGPEGIGGVQTYRIRPDWLASRAHSLAVTDTAAPDASINERFLPIAVPPNLERAYTRLQGRWVTVTGHFDDEAARTCAVTEGNPGDPGVPTQDQAVDICRASFVLTAVAPLVAPSTDTARAVMMDGAPAASGLPILVIAIAAGAAALSVRRVGRGSGRPLES
jgi:hypothetical protein